MAACRDVPFAQTAVKVVCLWLSRGEQEDAVGSYLEIVGRSYCPSGQVPANFSAGH